MFYPNTDYYTNFKLFALTHLDVKDIHTQDWYEQAQQTAQDIADDYGLTLETAAAVIAVLSPNLYWGRNIIIARQAIEAWYNGRRPENLTLAAYPLNVHKAFDILRNGLRVGHNLSGPKVTAFFENIVTGGNGRPTIDVWMVRMARSDFRIPIKTSGLTTKQSREMQAPLYTLAKELNVKVSKLQAAMWVKCKAIMRSRGQ